MDTEAPKAVRKRDRPAHVFLAQRFGVAIVTGKLAVGTILPSEIDIAARHGVARSVVREALRMISAKGLLESKPKAGTRVRERSYWNLMDPELLGWMFEGAPPLPFVRNLFQFRMMVEPAAAELAAANRTALDVARMGHALEEMAAAGLASEGGRVADEAFHRIIFEATGNEVLVSISAGITAAIRWTTILKFSGERHPRNLLAEHRRIFEAIVDGDGAAARDATALLIREAGADTERAMGYAPA